ncbi:chaperone NapD [Azospirillum doebereinerae]
MPRTPEIHVSSLVIQHSPDRTESLREAATAIAGLDWCAAENGKAVVTLVTRSAHEVLDHIATLNAVPGVHTTTMVFHHYEPEDADAVEAPAG